MDTPSKYKAISPMGWGDGDTAAQAVEELLRHNPGESLANVAVCKRVDHHGSYSYPESALQDPAAVREAVLARSVRHCIALRSVARAFGSEDLADRCDALALRFEQID